MALAIGGVGVGVDESSAPRRKGLHAFAVKREVFAVGEMSIPARRLLRKRLGSELDAVRDLLRKAEFYSRGAGAAGDDGRLLAPEAAPVEEDGCCRAANRRKVSPCAELTGEPEPDDRERLAGRLASMAAALPDHVVAFLQNRRAGDDDDGEIGMDVQSMRDGALLQLKMLLDKFAPESTPRSHGRRAPLLGSGISGLSQHQEAGDKMAPVQEEEEEGVDICGGVSRIAIRDIAEEYGELVEGVGVRLLSPLQRKYVDLAEQDEDVDICGYASPVVFPTKAGDRSSSSSSSSPSLSSSDDSDDSDSSSSSPDSDSESDPVISSRTPPPAFLPKENVTCAQAPEPTPEELPVLEPLDLPHKSAPPGNGAYKRPPAPEILSKDNDNYGQSPEPAPEATRTAEPEHQCAPTVFPIIKSPPAPTILPKDCGSGTLAQPSEPALEAAQIAEPEKLQDKCVVIAARLHHITGENATSSQPPPVPAPVAPRPQISQPPPPPPQASSEINDLIALAREKEKRRAMDNARQKLVEVERAALPDERIHPMDMELLGITAFEHIVSTVQDARTAQPQVNDGAGLRVSPGRPSILQQLGLFLKADEEEEEEEQPPPLAVASAGEDMEIEDGEIP